MSITSSFTTVTPKRMNPRMRRNWLRVRRPMPIKINACRLQSAETKPKRMNEEKSCWQKSKYLLPHKVTRRESHDRHLRPYGITLSSLPTAPADLGQSASNLPQETEL